MQGRVWKGQCQREAGPPLLLSQAHTQGVCWGSGPASPHLTPTPFLLPAFQDPFPSGKEPPSPLSHKLITFHPSLFSRENIHLPLVSE